MSDYYGDATLEDWLQEEVFRTSKPLPKEVVSLFERWREEVEANIDAWFDTNDGDGNQTSWRGWGRGFEAIREEDGVEFERLVEKGKETLNSIEVCNMKFQEAFNWMKKGRPVTLPSFKGYWFWDQDLGEIIIVTKDNERIPFKDTDDWDFTLGFTFLDTWTIYRGKDDPRENEEGWWNS